MAINQPSPPSKPTPQPVVGVPSLHIPPAAPDESDPTEAMTAPSVELLGQMSTVLRGNGEATWSAYRELRKITSALPEIGRMAAENIKAISADDALPLDHRQRRVQEIADDANSIIAKFQQASTAAATALEQSLIADVKPQPAKDPGQRMLIRQELATLLGNATGADLLKRMTDVAGQRQEWDAELGSPHGLALLTAAGMADSYPIVEKVIAEKQLLRQDGTERQQHARRALIHFRTNNLAARTVAFSERAKQYLR